MGAARPAVRRIGGLGLLALGLAAAGILVFLAGLFVTGGLDTFVPDACGALECLHGTARAQDGNLHCAKYPPVDVKMAGAGGRAYRRTRIAGGGALLLGVLLSARTVRAGWRAFAGRGAPPPFHRAAIHWAAPIAALSLALLARVLLWPLGFLSY